MSNLQDGKHYRFLLGNVVFKGFIKCVTGLHIGGSSDTIEIGGIDKPVIRNPLDNLPYIPGSSLKGKLRSIVEKIAEDKNGSPLIANRPGGDRDKKVWRHECDDFTQAAQCPLCRIFGSTGKKNQNNNYPGSLLVRDGKLHDPENKLVVDDIPLFETKMENCLDRLTSSAHPRTVERVPAGAEFTFELVYRIECMNEIKNGTPPILTCPSYLDHDLTNLITALEILEHDGIGGNISRGYGQIKIILNEMTVKDSSGQIYYKLPSSPAPPISLSQARQQIVSLSENLN